MSMIETKRKVGRPKGSRFYDPPWFKRFLELRKDGCTYHECAEKLNAEGYRAVQGGAISVDTLRCRVFNRINRPGGDE